MQRTNPRRSPLTLTALAGFALASLAATASAQQQFPSYIGPVNGNYFTPGNWTGGLVPTNGNGGFTFGPLFPVGVSVNCFNSPTVDKLQLDLGATLRISDNTNFTVIGDQGVDGTTGLISCRGTLILNSAGNPCDLRISGGTATFGGSTIEPGTIMGSNTQANRVFGLLGTERLVVGVGGILAGSMQLGINLLAVTNAGEIRASSPAGITVDPNGTGVINTGTISADGGTMNLSTGTYNSAGGFLTARNGSTLNIINSTRIQGGTLTTQNGGLITIGSGAVLAGSTLTGQARLPDNNHAFLESTHNIAASGTLTLLSAGNPCDLRINGNTTVNGPGVITTSNTQANRMYGNVGTETVTFAGGLTVTGSAQLGINLLNFIALPGTVVSAAQAAGMTIDPAGGGYLNRAILRAENGAVLTLNSGTFDNNGGEGLIVAENNSRVDINTSSIIGGTIDRNGTGFVRFFAGSVLANVLNTGFIQLPDNTHAFLNGTFTNSTAQGDGVLFLNSAGNPSDLRILGDVTLTGPGFINTSNTQANRMYAEGGVSRLTNAAGHTIRGSMQLGLNLMSMTNFGLVVADLPNGINIDMNGSGMINSGTLRSALGSNLTVNGGTVIDNTLGTLESQAGGTINLTGSSRVIGGMITGPGTVNALASAVLQNVTNSATITHLDNHPVFLAGTLTNNNTYRLNSAGNPSDLQIQGDVTINGTGAITSSNTQANRVYAPGGVGRLTNAAGHTIRGAMQLGTNSMSMTNNGLVLADQPIAMVIDMNGSGMINNATLRAAPSGTLAITGTVVSNASGQIESLPSGTVSIGGSSQIIGGLLTGGGAFSINGSAVLDSVTNFATLTQPDNNPAFLRGTFSNQNIYHINSAGNPSDLQILGDVTINGIGSITSSNTQANRIYVPGGAGRLTNGGGHTIRGAMQLGTNSMALTNEGAIIADQPIGMTIDPNGGGFQNAGFLRRAGSAFLNIVDGFSTTGTVQCDGGGTLRLSNGPWVQNGGLCVADGTIDVTSRNYALNQGQLSGNGRVIANVTNTGGTVDPGTPTGFDQTGTLIIEGNYVQGPSGNLSVKVGSVTDSTQNDFVSVLGTGQMGGTITISRENGFVPNVNQAFTILGTVGTNSRTGTFTSVNSPDFWAVVYLHNAVVIVFNGLGPNSCGVDFNNDGIVSPDDLDEFITAYFAGPPDNVGTDFNDDGITSPDDLDEFITAYFGGC